MKRRLFTILAALSLLLFVAVVVQWMRSYRYHDFAGHLKIERRQDGDRVCRQWMLGSRVGVVYFGYAVWTMPAWLETPGRGVPNEGFRAQSRRADPSPFDAGFNTVRRRFGRLVWVDETLAQGNWIRTRYLTVPAWVFALAFAAAPALYLFRLVRRRRALRLGQCLRCGYDLRATPGRCPECGETPAKAQA